jgi:aminomethyltransferase
MTSGNEELLRSALHGQHIACKAKMSDEAGWSVPLSYVGALDEAAEARRRAVVFDLSHFGRIRIRGDQAVELLERACTADVAPQEDDTAAWTPVCNAAGGIIDRVRLIRLADFWVMVTGPMCRQKVLQHLQALAEGYAAKADDQTGGTSMLAVAGPEAAGILSAVLPLAVSDMKPGEAALGSFMIARYIADRTDFAGTWGLTVQLPNMLAAQAWKYITARAGSNTVPPAGMAAWDVLRIEAGMCRYGHEMNETIHPLTLGLASEVDFDHDFVGRDALLATRGRPLARTLAGLVLNAPQGRGQAKIPAQGTPVLAAGGSEVGTVTSGTFSPALDRPVAMALLAPAAARNGVSLTLALADGNAPAQATDLPFVRGGQA